MKLAASKAVVFSFLALAFIVYSMAAGEQLVTVTATPTKLVADTTPPALSAEAYAIFDTATGEIITAQNGEAVLPIASVTKLITAAAVLEALPEEQEIVVADSDVATYGRAGRLTRGEKYTAHELLFPLILESSNDAAAAFERVTSGQVVTEMNELVKKIGTTQMALADASGLSAANVATAYDLAKVASYLFKTQPHIFDISRLSKSVGPYVGWTNNSPALAPEYRGGKHGYTEAANRTLVAMYEESFPAGPRTVGYVLLGSSDLSSDVASLREYVESSVHLE